MTSESTGDEHASAAWEYVTSYARADVFRAGQMTPFGGRLVAFFDRVAEAVRARAGATGHRDGAAIELGEHWTRALAGPLSRGRVLVVALSRNAVSSAYCSRAWGVFESRAMMAREAGASGVRAPIVPVYLDPRREMELPACVRRHLGFLDEPVGEYLRLGLRGLLRDEAEEEVAQLVERVADSIVGAAAEADVPALDGVVTFDGVPDVFRGATVAEFVAARGGAGGVATLGLWRALDNDWLEGQEAARPDQLARFFDGGGPTWAVARSERVPLLPLGRRLLQELEDEPRGVSMDLVVGAAGEGKSTLLRQLGCLLAQQPDVQVFALRPRAEHFDGAALAQRLGDATRTVLIIDHAAEHHDGLHAFLGEHHEAFAPSRDRGLHVIAATRPGPWEVRGAAQYAFRARCHRFQSWRQVGFDEAAAAAVVAGWDGALRRLAERPSEERAAVVHEEVSLARESESPGLFTGLFTTRFRPEDLDEFALGVQESLRAQGERFLLAWRLVALVDALTADEADGAPQDDGLDERVLAAVLEHAAPGDAGSPLTQVLETLEREAAIVPIVGATGRALQSRVVTVARRGLTAWLEEAPLRDVRALLERVVETTVEMVGDADTRLARCAPGVERRVGSLLGAAAARELAYTVARTGWEAERSVARFSDMLGVLVRSGDDDREVAAELIRTRWPTLVTLGGERGRLRSLVQKWANLERLRGNRGFALWLHLLALSDQLRAGGERLELGRLELKRGLVYTIRGAQRLELHGVLGALEVLTGLESELPRGDGEPTPWEPDASIPDAVTVEGALGSLEARIDRAQLADEVKALAEEGLSFTALRRAYTAEVQPRFGEIVPFVPEGGDADDIMLALLEFCESKGIEPYPEQEEAFELIARGDRNVILNTPTGSGKSLVAMAAHFAAYVKGERSIYTAPTKALVNEKFFDLCRAFGSRNVGLMHGDATANRDAKIICCTAEILANMALREGAETDFRWVVMDEFHYYGDRDRGMSWLLPLVTMDRARFLLMSATLGDPEERAQIVSRQTGTKTALVRGTTRPVPLEYDFRDQLLSEALADLREEGQLPVYLVTFGKREATELANEVTPLNIAKGTPQVLAAVQRERLDTPYGRLLARWLKKGVGVHHSGMLPRYRRLVERLAALPDGQGLQIICGTDTLGVGVNMPIRSVLFTRLYKFDGERIRILPTRGFQQVAGRAGRKNKSAAADGREEKGTVWVLAPQHMVRNRIARSKGKKKKLEKPPEGFKGWDRGTVERLQSGTPEKLFTRFDVSGAMVLTALSRPDEDGEAALRTLIERTGLSDVRRQRALERVDRVVEELAVNKHIRRREEADDGIGGWHVEHAQQLDTYERPLSRFLRAALDGLDGASGEDARPRWARAVSVVEATLPAGWKTDRDTGAMIRDPEPATVLKAQRGAERYRLVQMLRRAERDMETEEGVAHDLQQRIDTVLWPEPEKAYLATQWDAWRFQHPHSSGDGPAPRYVALEMYEQQYSFNAYIRHYQSAWRYSDLIVNEGRLLYYLSELYKVLRKEKPPQWLRDVEFEDFLAWLDATVREVDGTMVHEWEQFENSEDSPVNLARDEEPPVHDPTRRPRAFEIMVRNEAFTWVRALARRDYANLAATSTLSMHELRAKSEPYWEEFGELRYDADARATGLFTYARPDRVEQRLLDPERNLDWTLIGRVDVERSAEEGRAVVLLTDIRDLKTSPPE